MPKPSKSIWEEPVKPSWAERISSAKQRSSFTEEDVELAMSWYTCQVGELAPGLIPLHYPRLYGTNLYKLGIKFCRTVEDGYVALAEQIAEQIKEEICKQKQ